MPVPVSFPMVAPFRLKMQMVEGTRTIHLGQVVLVESSVPDEFYVVEDQGHRTICTCPDFVNRRMYPFRQDGTVNHQYGTSCKHIVKANLAREIDRDVTRGHAPAITTQPVRTPAAMYPSTCPETKEAWLPEPRSTRRQAAIDAINAFGAD